jgi:hypothetical protein
MVGQPAAWPTMPPCSLGRVADEHPLRCAECGRTPRDDENAADEWRAYSDGVGGLPVFCPDCASREFGYRLSRSVNTP